MEHPFKILKPEYTQLLALMQVRPECREELDKTATKLLGNESRYAAVSKINGVPVVFIAASFEREAASDFSRNAAQGWPLNSVSHDAPHNGPFRDWKSSAVAAYHLNGLDRVGTGNWTWELLCFYGEMFNGFGYRDFHHMHSPYLWGGTNLQTKGKYPRDGEWDSSVMDQQLGIVPMMRRMIEINPALAFSDVAFVPPVPVSSGIAAETGPDKQAYDAKWIQESLNELGFSPPLKITCSYNFATKIYVERFQRDFGLHVDGLVGPETTTGILKALENRKTASS